ncbi:hypothetical protein FRC07_002552 [Ceratobasidium sp. 392]|nr:hypothetical protein FRC07_002552 [Ceratobasidium sp. 392]
MYIGEPHRIVQPSDIMFVGEHSPRTPLAYISCNRTLLAHRAIQFWRGRVVHHIYGQGLTTWGNQQSLLPSVTDPILLLVLPEPQCNLSPFRKRITWLKSLAAVYLRHHEALFGEHLEAYESDSDPASLDTAISEACEALLWSRDTGLLPDCQFKLLLSLGQAYYERYWLGGPRKHLEDSVDCLRKALAYESAPTDRRLFCRQRLSTVAADLAKDLTESLAREDWLKSLELWQESVSLTGTEAPELLAERNFELAKTAIKIYQQSDDGTPAHVSEAAECLARAASITTSALFASEILFTRADALYTRFTQNANLEDLNEGIDSGERAYQLVRQVPGFIQQDLCCFGLHAHGTMISKRIQQNRAGNLVEKIEEIKHLIEVLESIIPYPYPFRLDGLDKLGKAYTLLYRTQVHAGQSPVQCVSSLEKAMQHHHAALKDTPSNNAPSFHLRYTLLGTVNHELSRIPESSNDSRTQHLESAIHYFRKANHTRGLSGFRNLALALESRYRLLHQPQDLDECISLLQRRNTSRGMHLTGRPSQFLDAATQLIRICREHDVNSQLLPSYRLLFKALQKLSHFGYTSTTRYQALFKNSAGHACDAAATALTLDEPTVAIELLEDGRNLFFSQLFPMQIDTNRIRALDTKLADRLEYYLKTVQECSAATDASDYKACYLYDQGGSAEDIDEDPTDISSQSTKLGYQVQLLELCLDEVCALPGHNDFMEPKSFFQLKNVARYCPVVYINISQYRCDAIILNGPEHSSQVMVVPLAVSWSKMYELSCAMQTAVKLQGRGVRDNKLDSESDRYLVRPYTGRSPAATIANVLKELWVSVANPVLAELNFLNGLLLSPEELPHICWCPAGPAATSLPLHAAGNYDLGPEHWAITHVVSSYTPTLSSSLQALGRSSNPNSGVNRVLFVSQPATPPSNPLPYVNQERDGVVAILQQPEHMHYTEATVLHDSAGRIADVKSMLPTYQILHLACHGEQNKYDPLESAILLSDGNLTLREVIKIPLPSAELVYLSACQTATGELVDQDSDKGTDICEGDIDSPDESLSLAGGFLFAGYRSAVATMWSINDKDGADVAQSFYKYLMCQERSFAMGAALALHCAVRDLKIASPDMSLTRWIPFMCLGVTGGIS